jgi:hypothetical protein
MTNLLKADPITARHLSHQRDLSIAFFERRIWLRVMIEPWRHPLIPRFSLAAARLVLPYGKNRLRVTLSIDRALR